MSRPTYISTGSSTTVKSGPGYLYGVHITPTAGSSLVVVDTVTGSGAGGFDMNSPTTTGLIARLPFSGASTSGPAFIPFWGVRFENGLGVSASSSASVTVYTD